MYIKKSILGFLVLIFSCQAFGAGDSSGLLTEYLSAREQIRLSAKMQGHLFAENMCPLLLESSSFSEYINILGQRASGSSRSIGRTFFKGFKAIALFTEGEDMISLSSYFTKVLLSSRGFSRGIEKCITDNDLEWDQENAYRVFSGRLQDSDARGRVIGAILSVFGIAKVGAIVAKAFSRLFARWFGRRATRISLYSKLAVVGLVVSVGAYSYAQVSTDERLKHAANSETGKETEGSLGTSCKVNKLDSYSRRAAKMIKTYLRFKDYQTEERLASFLLDLDYFWTEERGVNQFFTGCNTQAFNQDTVLRLQQVLSFLETRKNELEATYLAIDRKVDVSVELSAQDFYFLLLRDIKALNEKSDKTTEDYNLIDEKQFSRRVLLKEMRGERLSRDEEQFLDIVYLDYM